MNITYLLLLKIFFYNIKPTTKYTLGCAYLNNYVVILGANLLTQIKCIFFVFDLNILVNYLDFPDVIRPR